MMSKKEFWAFRAEPTVKSGVKAGAVFAFISAAVTLAVAITADPFMLIDVLIGAGMGIGLLVAKSRVCAIVLLLHFLASKLMQIQMGTFTGAAIPFTLLFVCGYAYAVYGTFQFHKSFRQYLENPQEQERWQPPQM